MLKLLSLKSSILRQEVSLPAITVASLDTLGHTVLRFANRSLELRSQNQRKVNQALNLPSPIILQGQGGNTLQGVLAPSCDHCDKNGHTKAECFKLKPNKPKPNHIFDGLTSTMKTNFTALPPQVCKVWVRNDGTINVMSKIFSSN